MPTIHHHSADSKLDLYRIKLARRYCNYSMDELCKRMGKDAVSKMAISKMERGLLKPSATTLTAIARACGVSINFFYPRQVNIGKLDFRFSEGITKQKADSIRQQVTDAIIDYANAKSCLPTNDDTFTLAPKKTIRTNADAEKAAETLRRKWNIGLQPIFSVYELLQNHGIHVIELEIDDLRIDGIATYVNSNMPFVVVNTLKHKTTERKRFTALHELAHLLFRMRPLSQDEHETYTSSLPVLPYDVTMKHADTERLCNLFASAMLLPGEAIARRIGSPRYDIDIRELISIREMYGISIAATVHRLHDLRIIPDTLYNYYYDSIIKPNIMETGWGTFPIMEHAETQLLLKIRIEKEIELTHMPKISFQNKHLKNRNY